MQLKKKKFFFKSPLDLLLSDLTKSECMARGNTPCPGKDSHAQERRPQKIMSSTFAKKPSGCLP